VLGQGEPTLTALLASADSSGDDLMRWARRLRLLSVGGAAQDVALDAESLEPIEPAAATEAADFLAHVAPRSLRLFRVALRPARPLAVAAGRTVQLFDLLADGRLCRSRSVAFFAGPTDRLRLAFACDSHVAQLWEDIGAAVDRHLPEAAATLLRPHRLLDEFIADANRLVARGELDLVVLGGDLVDHVHVGPRCDGSADESTNVRRLVEMLRPLEVPTFALPGNHDFRAFPWRPSLYGLGVVGLSRLQTKAVLRRAGLHDAWPLRRGDLHALRTTDAVGRSAIAAHLRWLNPRLNCACLARGTRLVLLSSGRDALPQWRNLEPSRWSMLARGLRWVWHDPDSEGFSEQQLVEASRWLSGSDGAAVFFHAPLFATGGKPISARLDVLRGDTQRSLAGRIAFERHTQALGLRRGVCLRNAGMLLDRLLEHRPPVAVFSGHLHASTAIALRRDTLDLRSVDVRAAWHDPESIPLYTAPAIGQVKPGVGDAPGYLLAQFESGRLVSVERRTLVVHTERNSLG